MDDMNAFERQLAAKVERMAGPDPRFNALEIARTAAAQSSMWRFQPIFSATRFVVAGAVVALFGGFLLAGVLTQSSEEPLPVVGASASTQAEPTDALLPTPEPSAAVSEPAITPTSDLLPGVDLVTEEVEPGVYRVLSDGQREVVYRHDEPVFPNARVVANIVAGYDGSMWILDQDRFYRLGDSETHPATPRTAFDPILGQRAYVDRDGTLWAMPLDWTVPRSERRKLYAFTGGEWQVRREDVEAFAVQPDGTVWVIRRELPLTSDDETTLERLDPDGWTRFFGPLYPIDASVHLMVGPGTRPSGDLDGAPDEVVDYVVTMPGNFDRGIVTLQGNTGFGEFNDGFPYLDVGAGGDIWAYWEDEVPIPGPGDMRSETAPYLTQARIDPPASVETTGGDVRVFTGIAATYGPDEGVPPAAEMSEGGGAMLRTGPDGRLWMAPRGPDGTCDGIASFDGDTWTHHLRDTCPAAIDFRTDGSAWVRAAAWPREEVLTYVITPEGVAAAADTATAAIGAPDDPGTASQGGTKGRSG